eukprot:EG_transcript_40560
MIDEAALNEEEVLLWAPGDENDDVWDDTELIKAYDAAMSQYFQAVGNDKYKTRARKETRSRGKRASPLVSPGKVEGFPKAAQSHKGRTSDAVAGQRPEAHHLVEHLPGHPPESTSTPHPVLHPCPAVGGTSFAGVVPPTPPLPPALLTNN